ncbi:MAG: antitoxin family protein [Nitrospirae bacterium]|nr:antitoxin family protein [Nitrospirota bacterium]
MKRKMEAVYENGTLKLAEPLPLAEHARVYVTVEDPRENDDDPSEYAWLRGAASNSAFDFLNDPAEDIYGPADGKPFRDAE